jgi:hypothetical protein
MFYQGVLKIGISKDYLSKKRLEDFKRFWGIPLIL